VAGRSAPARYRARIVVRKRCEWFDKEAAQLQRAVTKLQREVSDEGCTRKKQRSAAVDVTELRAVAPSDGTTVDTALARTHTMDSAPGVTGASSAAKTSSPGTESTTDPRLWAVVTKYRPHKPSELILVAPPDGWQHHQWDKNRFPLDEATWRRTFEIQTTSSVWVYSIRHLAFWVYVQGVPETERTPVQRIAANEYVVPEWMMELTTKIGRHPAKNEAAVAHYQPLSRHQLAYDPLEFATLSQYHQTAVHSCPFFDDANTLDMCLVRGANLLDVLSLDRSIKATAEIRATR
jgi:hypothetical protein